MRRLALFGFVLSLWSCNCGKSTVVEAHGVFRLNTEALDFGPVTEFTQATRPVRLENAGRGALNVTVTLEEGSSADFTLEATPTELPVGATVDVPITFRPLGAGSDTATLVITTDDADAPTARVPITGGPIFPALAFEPDPLAFAPVSSSLEQRTATLRSTGGASLRITAIGVSPQGSPDFSVTPVQLPLVLAPDASVPVQVTYAQSLNAADGLLEVVSDDADAGLRALRLLPDPAKVCGDTLDNDGDGLTDWPDDPGCTSADDADEYNPPECVNGGVQPCGSTTGACRQGSRVCANSIWGACDGGVRPAPEACNGVDDDCNGMSDENLSELCQVNGCTGARACVANSGVDGGLFTACIPVGSMPEQCNGLDDNCNGSVDEGVVQACAVFGCAGVRICLPGGDGGFTSCQPSNPLPESCNGQDDDCNGAVDDLPDVACGLGVCRRVVAACVDGGVNACVPGPVGVEACNGADDNCNGTVDDGVAPLTCGVGACFVTVNACLADGGMTTCVPGAPGAEVCNSVNDDCDGQTDEQADGGPLTQSCYTGPGGTSNVGVCRGGTQTCSGGSYGAGCPGQVVPSIELCNTLNDDCDGLTDEQADGGPLTQSCYTGPGGTLNVGRCRGGTQTCVGGSFGATCPGEVLPAGSETCGNSIDDNCNNQTDETCDAGSCAINGTWRVDGGAVAYQCAEIITGWYLVDINVTQFNFAINTPSAGTMRVSPQPTWSPGNTYRPTGPNATCPSGSMNTSVLYSGTCDETYRLTGSFAGPNVFNGTFTMEFVGACQDCVDQSFPVQLVR